MKKEFDSVERIKPIKHLVIHSFALTPLKMLDILHQYGLSVHYLIDSKGKVYSLVPKERVAWHAGISFWAGDNGLNQTSIGIELEHLDYGQTDFPKAQINAFIKLAKEIIKHHQIRPENVVGHSDISPVFKMDPGRGFPWKELAKNGIGLWYNLKETPKMPDLTAAKLLALIGYDTKGRALEASSWAFRQRFMPEVVPYDKEITKREKEVFKVRQMATNLPRKEQEKILASAPTIYPPNDGTYLTDPDFIKVLRAVAYQYQQARKN